MFNHTQVKFKCFSCGLHFVVCTWEPEKHNASSAHCPECGQHRGEFLVWKEDSKRPIFEIVPGAAVFVDFGPPRKLRQNLNDSNGATESLTFEKACNLHHAWVESNARDEGQGGPILETQPSASLSEEIDGVWHMESDNGRLAKVFPDGRVERWQDEEDK